MILFAIFARNYSNTITTQLLVDNLFSNLWVIVNFCRQHLEPLFPKCWVGEIGWPGFITVVSRTRTLFSDSRMSGHAKKNIVGVVP